MHEAKIIESGKGKMKRPFVFSLPVYDQPLSGSHLIQEGIRIFTRKNRLVSLGRKLSNIRHKKRGNPIGCLLPPPFLSLSRGGFSRMKENGVFSPSFGLIKQAEPKPKTVL